MFLVERLQREFGSKNQTKSLLKEMSAILQQRLGCARYNSWSLYAFNIFVIAISFVKHMWSSNKTYEN